MHALGEHFSLGMKDAFFIVTHFDVRKLCVPKSRIFSEYAIFSDRPHICVAYDTVQIRHYANFLRLHENSDFKDKLLHGELRINHLYVKISGVMDKVTQG